MASATNDPVVDTQHSDAVHDTQFDYYGRFLATCSSDRSIRIFSANSSPPSLVATLTGHEGPVWMVAWAHPKFGTALASAGYDGKAIVWKEGAPAWRPSTVITAHNASVNAVAWAPHEFGAVVASAGSDGNVFLTASEGGAWREPTALAVAGSNVPHPMGAMGVSFAPVASPSEERPLLATCGCDGSVKVWRAAAATSSAGGAWTLLDTFNEHRDWVRDVAFSPDAASSYYILASCAQDKTVIVRRRRRDAEAGAPWEVSQPATFQEVVFRLSWNPTGTALLVTTGDSNAFVLTPGAAFTDAWMRAPVAAVDGDLAS